MSVCAEVLGVHGIGQQKKTGPVLTEAWGSAMRRGVDLTGQGVLHPPYLDMAYYAHLFQKRDGRLGSVTTDTDPISPEENCFLEETLSSGFAGGIEVDPLAAQELGIPAVPGKLSRMLVRVDRKFGRGAGRYLLLVLRQVYRYLTDDSLARGMRGIVAAAVKSDTRIVLAHSLGSVIVCDMLLRGEIFQREEMRHASPRTIVTFGSPLPWPTIQRTLGHDFLSPTTRHTWFNVYDPADAVTGGQMIPSQQVINRRVSNGLRDPHAAVAYLRQPAIGAILISHADK
jgi:hypothetical protein